MILLHGLTGHMEERHILAVRDTCLAHGFSVLRADLYGHGASGGAFRDHDDVAADRRHALQRG